MKDLEQGLPVCPRVPTEDPTAPREACMSPTLMLTFAHRDLLHPFLMSCVRMCTPYIGRCAAQGWRADCAMRAVACCPLPRTSSTLRFQQLAPAALFSASFTSLVASIHLKQWGRRAGQLHMARPAKTVVCVCCLATGLYSRRPFSQCTQFQRL